MKKNYFFILLLFLFPLSFFSQNNLQLISTTKGGGCYEVCYYNGYLYAGAGNTLIVYDVSSGNPPYNKVFEYVCKSNIDNIQTHNGFLYVSANHAGLYKWNISNPASPQFVTEFVPATLDEAVYDITFYGTDTIFAAYKTKVAVFKDNASSFQLLTTIAQQALISRIRGVATKNNLLAFTVSYSSGNTNDGVYLYNAKTLTQLSYTKQTYCDPEDVVFGQNTNLMHVLGGTNTMTNPFDMNGLFYSLDITTPTAPVEMFRDTINGFLLLGSISQPMNAEIINDTIYVATQGGNEVPISGAYTCSVYVYDVKNPTGIHFITDIYGGLYHFDIAINNHKMYVASEWYGVLTVDITDIFNESEIGRTLTGSWNISADKYGNKMVLANEGVGIKLYDIANLQNPVLLGEDTAVGFCMSADFSSDGNYVYGYYLTDKQFRVFSVSTMSLVGSINTDVGEKRTFTYNNKAIALSGTKVTIVNASTPAAPVIQAQLSIAANDMFVTNTGKMFLATNDSMMVYDINGVTPLRLNSIAAGFLQDFKTLTYYKDTIYTYVSNKGLVRYTYNPGNNSFAQTQQVTPNNGLPAVMAVDSFALYLGYIPYGIDVYKKTNLAFAGNYRTGLEFVHDFLWGIQDIVCKDNLILLAEYQSQTSILTNNPNFILSVNNNFDATNNQPELLTVYPNPAKDMFTIDAGFLPETDMDLAIFDIHGNLIVNEKIAKPYVIHTDKFKNGIYLIQLQTTEKVYRSKLEVVR